MESVINSANVRINKTNEKKKLTKTKQKVDKIVRIFSSNFKRPQIE